MGSDVWLSYDYRRLRVGESVDHGDDEWENISTMYDARGNLVERYDSWMYGDSQYAYGDGIDEVVLVRTGDYYGQNLFALVTDHLGTVVAIVTDKGEVWASHDYHPFGDVPVGQTFGDWLGVVGFTGREYDSETGLYYYRNRWYSMELGRFLEPDPIGLAGWDVNLYRYVGNGPVNATDPTGHNLILIGIAAGLLIGGVIWAAWKITKEYKEEVSKLKGSGAGDLESSIIPLKPTVVKPLVMEELKMAAKTPMIGPDDMKDLLLDVILKDPLVGEILDKASEVVCEK